MHDLHGKASREIAQRILATIDFRTYQHAMVKQRMAAIQAAVRTENGELAYNLTANFCDDGNLPIVEETFQDLVDQVEWE